jgi:hypothetical protein
MAQKMIRGRVAPYAMPTLVQAMPIVLHVARQTIEVPQMTSPQEKHFRERKQNVKREHDTTFPEGEEHL